MFIVQIAGHLGKDPETRFTPSGQKVTAFTVATNHRKGKEDVTVWVRVTVWGDRLDKVISYLKKGSGIIVVGKMNPPSSYVDKEGRTQFSLEVTAEMIEFSPFGKGDRQEGGMANGAPAAANNHTSAYEENNFAGNYSRSNNYQNGSSMGQGSSMNTMDDDALPF
jgi:single-strand DNA-binding protein